MTLRWAVALSFVLGATACSMDLCKHPPQTLHLGQSVVHNVELWALVEDSTFDAELALRWGSCAHLAETAAANVNGIGMDGPIEQHSHGWFCSCPTEPLFFLSDPMTLPASSDAIFEVIDADWVVRMVVPNLFAVGLALRYPEQPAVAGQPLELMVQAPPDNVANVRVGIVRHAVGNLADVPFDPAAHQDPAWVYLMPSDIDPGQYKLVAWWDFLPNNVSCEGAEQCTLVPWGFSVRQSLEITVSP